MANNITHSISRKTGTPGIEELLSSKLNSSELSSLLLEVYHQRSQQIKPAELLKQYRNNKFVQPADADPIGCMEKELQVLRFLQQQQYIPIELSPVAQFGSCSAVGTVNQKKILSAVRQTEVMADATNAIALHIADIKQHQPVNSLLRYCTIHRHIRAVHLPLKGYSPHFKIACMVAAARDTGNFEFELTTLREQLLHIHHLLTVIFGVQKIVVEIQPRSGYKNGEALIAAQMNTLQAQLPFEVRQAATKENNYYKGLQFKVRMLVNEREFEIADGGFVDWTQQLLENKKERCLISGIGISLLHKLLLPESNL
ncbi:MAG: hypothetical protein QM731_09855 [Chitinophagaceae bacterium]